MTMKESVKNVPHDMGDVSFYDAFGEKVFASSGDAAHVRDYRRCEEVIDGYRCWGIYVEGVGCTNPDCPAM